MTPEFKPFPKIPRLSREVLITEKIDGTNASICITENFKGWVAPEFAVHTWKDHHARHWALFAGSRTRWITPDNDNYGFARWVKENAEELLHLGPGHHFGEWWGCGIQRGYGLKEKRFSLFNVSRWHLHGTAPQRIKSADPRIVKWTEELPPCVGLVPLLYRGVFSTGIADAMLCDLAERGSQASPGFMDPEGVVVYHAAANFGFKKTIHKDEEPKSK